jgi:hypothetical protein
LFWGMAAVLGVGFAGLARVVFRPRD